MSEYIYISLNSKVSSSGPLAHSFLAGELFRLEFLYSGTTGGTHLFGSDSKEAVCPKLGAWSHGT